MVHTTSITTPSRMFPVFAYKEKFKFITLRILQQILELRGMFNVNLS